jgi:alpha-tubulin suppressor-like RCC1 family protein
VIGLSSGVSKVDVGNDTTCAVLVGGGLKCWGLNTSGQLGDGTTTSRSTPTDVSGLASGVADVAVGNRHVCAALTDGTVKCWGYNLSWQVGVEPKGPSYKELTPVAVPGLSGVTKVAVGYQHSCALTGAGGVKCWGASEYGLLGNGINNDPERGRPPGDVIGLTSGVASVVVARDSVYDHTCAVMTNGTVRCWGFDEWGQTGDRRLGFALTPTNVLLNGVGTSGGNVTPTESNGNTTFTFAGNTFTASIVLSYSVPTAVPPLGNLRGVNRVFDVTPYYADSGLPATPTGRYTTTVTYAEADLGGAAEGSLGLYFWDGSQWVLEPSSSVDAAANTVSASPNHFSTWAVLSNPQASNKKYVYLPMIRK